MLLMSSRTKSDNENPDENTELQHIENSKSLRSKTTKFKHILI